MFGRVLNMARDYLSFSVVLKRIHRSIDIYQTDHSIHSKLRIFPLFSSHSWKCNIQTNERLTKVKAKWSPIQFDVFDLSFIHFLHSNVPDNKSNEQKWHVLFLTLIKLVAHVLACASAVARIKWRRMNPIIYKFFKDY